MGRRGKNITHSPSHLIPHLSHTPSYTYFLPSHPTHHSLHPLQLATFTLFPEYFHFPFANRQFFLFVDNHKPFLINMSQYPPPGQQPYYGSPPPPQGGYPPQGYPPPGQQPMYYPPQGQAPPPQEEKKDDKGCLYGCIATLCCCWLCGETCECCLECLTCCF
ncbi:hypothetical protein CaCOL14_002459 [Colletotrichum acutatum]